MTAGISMDRFVDLIKWWHPSAPSVIWDIGSMNGSDAVHLGASFPSAQVHAFEANPEEHARHHPDIDGWHNLLLWDAAGTRDFHMKVLGSGIHSARNRGERYPGTMEVRPSIRADQIDVPAPDVVKLDVEGCSLEVLRGLGDMLAGVDVIHVETETRELFEGQALAREVFDLLWDSGMDLIEHSFCCVFQYDSVWARR